MREAARVHAPTFTAFLLMVAVAASIGATLHASLGAAGGSPVSGPATPIVLPPPDQDADGDSYGDDVDRYDGDAEVVLHVDRLRLQGDVAPYLVVGTQDDHWRTGAGAELEWRHVVDYDPLGAQPGSGTWKERSLRTGAWWVSEPMEGERIAMARTGRLDESPPDGVTWPQRFHVNVRDDRAAVQLEVAVWDAASKPDRLVGRWELSVDPEAGWRSGENGTLRPLDQRINLTTTPGGSEGITVRVAWQAALDAGTRQELADRWAPALRFDSGGRFFPTNGSLLGRFHGFWVRDPDLRTWQTGFNNGRDAYRLLLADFTGDGGVDHRDAAVMTDVLREGGAADHLYANVVETTNGRVVVQYWLLYFYNFVPDETGQDIPELAHRGDREFMQLTFASLDDARNGFPTTVAYSQHYRGIRIDDVRPGTPPFHLHDRNPAIYPALGSHASYPVAGDDQALRRAYAGFGDRFDGQGEAWDPDEYDVEVLGSQEWHQGYKWGPFTRHARDMGTALRPLQQHTFRYPFTDPLYWQAGLEVLEAGELEDVYRTQRIAEDAS